MVEALLSKLLQNKTKTINDQLEADRTLQWKSWKLQMKDLQYLHADLQDEGVFYFSAPRQILTELLVIKYTSGKCILHSE